MHFFIVALLSVLLTGCLGTVWSGVSLLYDRHAVYDQLSDFDLGSRAQHALFDDGILRQSDCVLELAVFNGDILLAGHVPTNELRDTAFERISQLKGYRTFFKQVAVSENTANSLVDSWITSKIRSQIFADSSIAPKEFKIVTVDQIVYIMGDLRAEQAAKVVEIASNTDQVVRVVKLFRELIDKKVRNNVSDELPNN